MSTSRRAHFCPVDTPFCSLTVVGKKIDKKKQATLPGAALRDLFLLNNAEYVLANTKVIPLSLSLLLLMVVCRLAAGGCATGVAAAHRSN